MAKEWTNKHKDDDNDRYGAQMLIGDVWALSAPQLLLARELGTS